MRAYFRRCALFSLLMLCGAPVCLAQTETEDHSTQRNHMHSCPLGSFVSGVQVARNLLLCTTAPLDTSSEIVDSGTQSHACTHALKAT